MKHLSHILGFVAVICLAFSCAKIEQTGDVVADKQISYNVISQKQSVKSTTYPTNTPFISYAWLLPTGKSWDNEIDRISAQTYINKATIQHQDGRWYQVVTADGVQGYVSSTYVEIINE